MMKRWQRLVEVKHSLARYEGNEQVLTLIIRNALPEILGQVTSRRVIDVTLEQGNLTLVIGEQQWLACLREQLPMLSERLKDRFHQIKKVSLKE